VFSSLFFRDVRLRTDRSFLESDETPTGTIDNPLSWSWVRGHFERLTKIAPFFVWLFTGGRSDNAALEQNNGIIRYHDIIPPWTKLRLDEYISRIATTMAGKAKQAVVNLNRSAYVLTQDEAQLYSQWNKSNVHFTPPMRDLQRDLSFRYKSLGSNRRQLILQHLLRIDPDCKMSPATVTNTMSGKRAFWKDEQELKTWRQWLDIWNQQPLPDGLPLFPFMIDTLSYRPPNLSSYCKVWCLS